MSTPVDIALVRGPALGGTARSMPLPPLGMLYVASALEAAGFRVAVVDADGEGLTQAEFIARLRLLRPEVIGLSGMTPMKGLIARDLTLVRPLCRRVVLGGVHATRFREQVLDEFPAIDALVVGEGEEVAVALLRWWDTGMAGKPPCRGPRPGRSLRGRLSSR